MGAGGFPVYGQGSRASTRGQRRDVNEEKSMTADEREPEETPREEGVDPHRDEGDAATLPQDPTQVDSDRQRAGISTRRPPAGGEGHLEEIRPDDDRVASDLPRRPQDSDLPDEHPRSF
jgi:hypothetical protein